MIRSDTEKWPPRRYTNMFHKYILEFRQLLTRYVDFSDGAYNYRLRCETVREFNRCVKIFIKEPGTVDWIDKNFKPGDIFYDIGANIGVFTILAASRVGKEGRVYAFEPHGANFARLIDNITANNLQQVIFPNNFALNNKEGFFAFHYSSGEVGTSDSQLSGSGDVTRGENVGLISELKYATSVDHLIESGNIKAPHHIKVDVDGNELLILEGMRNLLSSPKRPRTLQIEMNAPHKMETQEFMKDHQYRLAHKHYTRSKTKKIQKGYDPEALDYNAIFISEK